MIHGFDDADKKKVEVPAKTEAVLKTQLLNLVYPVGSIYMSVNNTSPATLFGGTWEAISGRFLLASGSGYANGSTGGEASHKLTVAEMPSHSHVYSAPTGLFMGLNGTNTQQPIDNIRTGEQGANSDAAGSGQAHNNMPPYLVVNVWKRTA